MVFFVLSRFLVGRNVVDEAMRRQFEWRVYLAKRLSRLWSVLAAGLAFTALMDRLAFGGRLLGLMLTRLLGAALATAMPRLQRRMAARRMSVPVAVSALLALMMASSTLRPNEVARS